MRSNPTWGKYPDQQLHDDRVSLCGSHVQRRPVHLGASVSANPGSQQDVSCGVMAVLGCEVEGGRAQLQTGDRLGSINNLNLKLHPGYQQ